MDESSEQPEGHPSSDSSRCPCKPWLPPSFTSHVPHKGQDMDSLRSPRAHDKRELLLLTRLDEHAMCMSTPRDDAMQPITETNCWQVTWDSRLLATPPPPSLIKHGKNSSQAMLKQRQNACLMQGADEKMSRIPGPSASQIQGASGKIPESKCE